MPNNQNKAASRYLRRNQSDAEQRLWYWLRDRRTGDAKFRRQYPIKQYVVDFVCLEKGLVVELDGGQHSEREAADARRTAILQSDGYRVLRFWNDEVLKDTPAVLERIMTELAGSRDALTRPFLGRPLPEGEAKGHGVEHLR